MTTAVFRLFGAASILALAMQAQAPSIAAESPTELLNNPGFEAPYTTLPASHGKAVITGAVASGWGDNSSWADVTVEYAQVTEGTHSGSSAQKVTVKEVRSGGVQLVQTIPLVANHIYTLSMWVKGKTGVQTSISIRQLGPPYRTYIQKAVELNDTWQQVTMRTTPTDSTTDCIMIYPPTGSSLLIDDASLKDVTSAASDAPVKTGNLLSDSSFEAGFGGGWSARARLGDTQSASVYEYTDPRPVIDSTSAADQKQSVKMTLPCAASAAFLSPLVTYNYGRPHTASVWVKSDIAGASATLQMLGSTDTKSVRLTNSWQRATLTTTLPYGDATRLTVTEVSPAAGTVWLDNAELCEGNTIVSSPHSAELALSVDRPGGVFFDGESALVHVATANAPAGATVRATCLDLYGHTLTLPTQSATVTALKITPDAAHPRGVFKVTAQLFGKDGKSLTAPIQQVFARLPRPREITPEKSYFGVHIPLAPEYFQLARATGSRWCRIHDASWVTKWPVVEPKLGEFVFTDTGVDAARKAGLAVLGMLDGGPVWASVKPKALVGYFSNYNIVDAPNAESEWATYVQKVVGHYKGKIDYWEVWNEPWGLFTPGSPELYGRLLKSAYPIAKAANSNAVIVGIDAARAKDAFTEGALKTAGGSSSYDEFSFHEYYAGLYGGPASPAATDAARYDLFENKYGHTTPRWMTETAPAEGVQSLYWPIGKEQDTRLQYAKTIRFDVSEIGHGVKHLFYYSLHADPAYGDNGLIGLEHDRTIRPVIAGRAVLASLIDGAACSERLEPVPGVDSYDFTQVNGSHINVLWSYDGTSHRISVPKGAKVLDALGNPLTVTGSIMVGLEPIYVLK